MCFLTAALLFCQQLTPTPEIAVPGDAVRVVVEDASGAPIAAVPVDVCMPGGDVVRLGIAGADGSVQFTPVEAGDYELRAELPDTGVRLLRPYTVLPAPRRWLYVLLCLPAGVLLLAWNLRNAFGKSG